MAFILRSNIRYIDEERNLIVPTTHVLRTNVVLTSSDFTNVVQVSFKHFIVMVAKYGSLTRHLDSIKEKQEIGYYLFGR